MVNIVIYSDFDGTATSQVGLNTINSAFYQSLLEGYTPGVIQNYSEARLKSTEVVQRLFLEKFGQYLGTHNPTLDDNRLLMSPNAVSFFREALASPHIKVNIVSKNREDYIKEMFRYQGFSAEEISKLTIMSMTIKRTSVKEDLMSLPANPNRHLFIFDDDMADYNQMCWAALDCNYSVDNIHGCYHPPEEDAWLSNLKEVQETLNQILQHRFEPIKNTTLLKKNGHFKVTPRSSSKSDEEDDVEYQNEGYQST